ncbi:hypothetical protein [Variovorax boronicumulans]|uniref:hypothetical protein n=1 Tax=Variovorax boronicumulans TaxID=436515 RepID=UPI001C58BDBF
MRLAPVEAFETAPGEGAWPSTSGNVPAFHSQQAVASLSAGEKLHAAWLRPKEDETVFKATAYSRVQEEQMTYTQIFATLALVALFIAGIRLRRRQAKRLNARLSERVELTQSVLDALNQSQPSGRRRR